MHPAAENVLQWYRAHARDLPWRHTRDPYRIWISEAILQQTRIATGLAYYERFVTRLPTVAHLAAATPEQVMKLWEGLGYYSRARNLHKAAQAIVREHAGQFPRTVAALEALPGIGPYTARAVASIAFGVRTAVLDGNVFRVLSRLYADATPIDAPRARAHYQPLADATLGPDADPGAFNQAMMDLGATVCTPRDPDCLHCPLQPHCRAFQQDAVARFPVKGKAKAKPERYMDYLLVTDGTQLVVAQRTEGKLWRELWELPRRELPDFGTPPHGAEWFRLKHVFTHFTLHIRVVRVPLASYRPGPDERVITWAQVPDYAFNQAVHKVFAEWRAQQQSLFAGH